MVRPAGHGRGANDPPKPEFFARMMQQFDLNRQFMEGMMAQFPRPNMNQQPTPVTLQDFMRLSQLFTAAQLNPSMLMTGSATSRMKWSLLLWPLLAMSPLHHSF